MKIKKFIYAMLLFVFAFVLPGCENQETVELDVRLEFPWDYDPANSDAIVSLEKLYFAVFDGNAVLEQKKVDVSEGKVSLLAPLGKDLSVGVVGSGKVKEGSGMVERALVIGSKKLGEVDASESEKKKVISIGLKKAEWGIADMSGGFDPKLDFHIDQDYKNKAISWAESGLPNTIYHLYKKENIDNIELFSGTNLSFAAGEDFWQGQKIFFVEFPCFGLRTKDFEFYIR